MEQLIGERLAGQVKGTLLGLRSRQVRRTAGSGREQGHQMVNFPEGLHHRMEAQQPETGSQQG